MKILITGANGQLGYDLKKAFRNHQLILTDTQNMDITDPKKVNFVIEKNKPEIIIHAAAYTNVDKAEADKKTCQKVNVLGTKNVAAAAEKVGATLIYISTDYVFSGTKKSPYKETDAPRPINVYGKSKLAGERWVQKICKHSYIIRSAWLYGEGGGNFVKTMLELSKKLPKLEVVADQKGTPTYTKDLAEGIAKLLKIRPKYGIYNMTNSGTCSWYQFAREIFKLKNLKTPLSPTDSKKFKRPARRPAYSVLSKEKIRRLGIKMWPWPLALKSFLESLKNL